MGKERKYTGLAKGRMIDLLLNVVLGNKRKQNPNAASDVLQLKLQPWAKKQKKSEDSKEMLDNLDPIGGKNHVEGEVKCLLLCKNLACRATLRPMDGVCKRCSCCICHKYDDNKDPSLWLTCNSDPPFEGSACGLSLHLKCALKHERAGILKNSCKKLDGQFSCVACGKVNDLMKCALQHERAGILKNTCKKLDGQFSCVACGKVNDLMSTWNKQLLIAKGARRVDVLCLRISLCYKILEAPNHIRIFTSLLILLQRS